MNKPIEMETVPFWVAGRGVASTGGRSGDVRNPATGGITKRVSFANAGDVDTAVQAAQAALPAWRDAPPLRRARVMQKFLQLLQTEQEGLAQIICEEHGKTLPDALGEVLRGMEVVEFACGTRIS